MRDFNLRVILVRSLYDSNIGATSRAMGNMGVKELYLIAPQCEITYQAQQSAAGGQYALQNRKHFKDWEDFLSNTEEGLRLSFSARDGRSRPLWDCKKLLNWLQTEDPRFQKSGEPVNVDLVFGPEDAGLSNDDVDHCHFNVNIPTYGDHSSLNLAQAVLLALFIVRSEWGGQRTKLDGQQSSRYKKKNLDFDPDQTLKSWLSEMGFVVENKRINVYTVLRRLLFHNVPTPKELRVLETVLQQGRRKLQEWKALQIWLQKNQNKMNHAALESLPEFVDLNNSFFKESDSEDQAPL